MRGRDGVRLRVRVRPGGSRTAILGRNRLPGGEWAVLVAVSAPPRDGAANAALAAFLAKTWRVPKTSITVAVGAGGRGKLLEVAGAPDELMTRLAPWLADLPEL
jgi:uncharacterized protein (TIGR00251 family)